MTIVLLALAALAAAPPSGQATKDNEERTPRVARVIDPTYSPQVGDRANVDTGQKDEDGDPYGVEAAVSVQELVNFIRLSNSRNNDAINKMEDAKTLFLLEAGTAVLVTALSPIEVARIQLPQGALKGALPCAEIKVLDGEFKGKILYMVSYRIVHYVTIPIAANTPAAKAKRSKGTKKPKSPAASAKPATDPGARAASMLKLGQSLEKAGKTAGAIEYYRKVLKEFAESAPAKTAAERIKALESRD